MKDVEITEVKREIPSVSTITFDSPLENALPGQFGMVWIAGEGQRPMSFSAKDQFTVKEIGPFSRKMASLSPGDKISIDGPLGNGFSIHGSSVVLVGGGCGLAPLRFLASKCNQEGIDVTTLMGFRTKDEVFFEKEFTSYGDVYIATEDGSCGEKGLITCLFDAAGTSFDFCYSCGPERMMKAIGDMLCNKMGVEVSLERYMKCGVGLCGSCEIDGLLVCKDGPVFDYNKLGPSFGSTKRDRSGARIPL